MKNYRFYKMDGNSMNVFGVPRLRANNRDLGNNDIEMYLLDSEKEFLSESIEYVEIDKQGHAIESEITFEDWWDENENELNMMVMRNGFAGAKQMARKAFEAGK